MLERTLIPGFDDFDAGAADVEELQRKLASFSRRLHGLVMRRNDMKLFRQKLLGDRPYFTVAVETRLDDERNYIIDKHFYVPLENGGVEHILALLPESERQLNVEIEHTKEQIRKIVLAY
jgi:hypothetical protein